jgi:hypothetical protein
VFVIKFFLRDIFSVKIHPHLSPPPSRVKEKLYVQDMNFNKLYYKRWEISNITVYSF